MPTREEVLRMAKALEGRGGTLPTQLSPSPYGSTGSLMPRDEPWPISSYAEEYLPGHGRRLVEGLDMVTGIPQAVDTVRKEAAGHDAGALDRAIALGVMLPGAAAGRKGFAAAAKNPNVQRFAADVSGSAKLPGMGHNRPPSTMQIIPAEEAIAKNVAEKRSVSAIFPEVRKMDLDTAIDYAKTQPHLVPKKEGGFVGGPRWVKNPADLEKMRVTLDEYVERGLDGWDWYHRTRAGNREIAPMAKGQAKNSQDFISQIQGLTSSQAAPESNIQFTLQGYNAMNAGVPRSIVRDGEKATALRKAWEAQYPIKLGDKTGAYADNVNPTLPMPVTGANDIWHSRGFGYTNADGSFFSRNATKSEHSFMDIETLLAVDRANARKLGGRTNWEAGEIQAAAWVELKATDLMKESAEAHAKKLAKGQKAKPPKTYEEAFEEAMKTYPDYFDKHTVQLTSEVIPARGGGHLENLIDADMATKQAYSDAPGNWIDPETGRDVLMDGAGVYSRKPEQAMGVYPNPAGQLEYNQVSVGRMLGDFKTGDESLTKYGGLGAGKELSDATKGTADVIQGTRAYFDIQNMGAWGKFHPQGPSGAKAGATNSLKIGLGRKLSEEEAKRVRAIGAEHGLDLIDHGDGFVMTDFGGTTNAAGKKVYAGEAKDITKKMKDAGFMGEIRKAVPDAGGVQRGRFEGSGLDKNYQHPLDYAGDYWGPGNKWSKPGSGEATTMLAKILNDPRAPALAKRIGEDPAVRKNVLAQIDRDLAWAKKTGAPVREDLMRARKLFGEGGFEALFAALKRGEKLPMVPALIAPLLAPALVGGQQPGRGQL